MQANTLMIQGITSAAGKSILPRREGLCRVLLCHESKDGYQ